MTEPGKAYPKYLLDITRVYSPRMLPSVEHSKWVGKPVTVIWQQPIFSLFGGGGKAGPLHELIRWYGYVVELDKKIPDDELPRKDMRVQPKKRNT